MCICWKSAIISYYPIMGRLDAVRNITRTYYLIMPTSGAQNVIIVIAYRYDRISQILWHDNILQCRFSFDCVYTDIIIMGNNVLCRWKFKLNFLYSIFYHFYGFLRFYHDVYTFLETTFLKSVQTFYIYTFKNQKLDDIYYLWSLLFLSSQ